MHNLERLLHQELPETVEINQERERLKVKLTSRRSAENTPVLFFLTYQSILSTVSNEEQEDYSL